MSISLRGLTRIGLVSSLVILSGSVLRAEEHTALPRDLQQLLQKWERIPKDATLVGKNWQVGPVSFEEGKEPTIASLARKSLEAAESQGGVVTHLVAKNTSTDTRTQILKLLTPQQNADTFCTGLTLTEFVAKPSEHLNADQLAERKERHRLNQCHTQIKRIFSGIFHANPSLLMVEVKYRQGESEKQNLEIYLPSLISSKQWLNYRIVIR